MRAWRQCCVPLAQAPLSPVQEKVTDVHFVTGPSRTSLLDFSFCVGLWLTVPLSSFIFRKLSCSDFPIALPSVKAERVTASIKVLWAANNGSHLRMIYPERVGDFLLRRDHLTFAHNNLVSFYVYFLSIL